MALAKAQLLLEASGSPVKLTAHAMAMPSDVAALVKGLFAVEPGPQAAAKLGVDVEAGHSLLGAEKANAADLRQLRDRVPAGWWMEASTSVTARDWRRTVYGLACGVVGGLPGEDAAGGQHLRQVEHLLGLEVAGLREVELIPRLVDAHH